MDIYDQWYRENYALLFLLLLTKKTNNKTEIKKYEC